MQRKYENMLCQNFNYFFFSKATNVFIFFLFFKLGGLYAFPTPSTPLRGDIGPNGF